MLACEQSLMQDDAVEAVKPDITFQPDKGMATGCRPEFNI
jgi:hypothetical protein